MTTVYEAAGGAEGLLQKRGRHRLRTQPRGALNSPRCEAPGREVCRVAAIRRRCAARGSQQALGVVVPPSTTHRPCSGWTRIWSSQRVGVEAGRTARPFASTVRAAVVS